jgi:hypothetical protein
MPDDTNAEIAPSTEAQPEPAQTDPPPYEPDKDLIGYVEKGQNPSAPRPRPSERR